MVMHGNGCKTGTAKTTMHKAHPPTLKDQQVAASASCVVVVGIKPPTDSWRSSFRKSYEPDYRGISIGFRLVMAAD
ncbi:MAG: hypothetical protein V7K25_28140 [Nostoc sp.]